MVQWGVVYYCFTNINVAMFWAQRTDVFIEKNTGRSGDSGAEFGSLWHKQAGRTHEFRRGRPVVVAGEVRELNGDFTAMVDYCADDIWYIPIFSMVKKHLK